MKFLLPGIYILQYTNKIMDVIHVTVHLFANILQDNYNQRFEIPPPPPPTICLVFECRFSHPVLISLLTQQYL